VASRWLLRLGVRKCAHYIHSWDGMPSLALGGRAGCPTACSLEDSGCCGLQESAVPSANALASARLCAPAMCRGCLCWTLLVWCLGFATGDLRSFPSLFPISLHSVPMVLLARYTLWRCRMTLDLLRLPCLVVLFLCPPFGLGASSCNTPVSQPTLAGSLDASLHTGMGYGLPRSGGKRMDEG
jgi:hypothetical protein